MTKIASKREDIEIYLLSAGQYFADAGAAMGVYPYKLWHDKVELDADNCIKMELNSLLIKTKDTNIIVDCGIGDYITDRQRKIYKPSKSTLIEELQSVGLDKNDINLVILTHLHFDHAGGILATEGEFTFPNARYVIQQEEWNTAQNPSLYFTASYPLTEHYKMLLDNDCTMLVSGEKEIYKDVFVKKIAGHCPGAQVVRIVDKDNVIYFAGDAFPSSFHLPPPITSAYEMSRIDLYEQKEMILDELKKYGGKLILSHDKDNPIVEYVR